LSVIFYQNKQKVWLVWWKQIFPESITDIEFLKNLFIQK
jgi:hypothetical protein